MMAGRKLPSRHALWQAGRFAIVGLLATIVHVTVFTLLSMSGTLAPWLANVAGFLAAFSISFAGHHHWTFPGGASDSEAGRRRLVRFVAVALIGFSLNAAIVYVTGTLLGLSPLHASVLMLTVSPVALFVLNRQWAFAGSDETAVPSDGPPAP